MSSHTAGWRARKRAREASAVTTTTDHQQQNLPPGAITPAPGGGLDENAQLRRRALLADERVRDLMRKLQHSDRNAGIIAELVTVLERTVSPIEIDCPHALHIVAEENRQQEEVDAVVTLSDQHGDRVIHSEHTWGLERYDFNVFCARLYEWAKVIKAYTTKHLPNYKFHTLWVLHAGDAVNGDIHNMKHQNAFGNTLEAAIKVGDAQAQALAFLAPHFQRIVVVCVSGNHGRTTPKMNLEDPWDNMDYLVAKTMELRLKGTPLADKVEIVIPRAWTAYISIRGKLWSINHGNGVKGTWGIPWYGFERREGRLQKLVGTMDQQVDYFVYGHFHTPMTRPTGRGKAIHAGAFFATDAYSLNDLNLSNEPEQPMIVTSERFGRQIEIPIMLRDRAREDEMHKGLWTPPFGRVDVIEATASDAAIGRLPVIA